MDNCPHCQKSFGVSAAARMPWAKDARLRAAAARVYEQGKRACVEAFAELIYHGGGRECAIAMFEKYEVRGTPELLRAVGAGRMPPPAFRVVPDDLQLARARLRAGGGGS